MAICELTGAWLRAGSTVRCSAMALSRLVLREALASATTVYAPAHSKIAEAMSGLGAALVALHRFEEAAPLLLEAERLLAAKLGEEAPPTRRARARLEALKQARAVASSRGCAMPAPSDAVTGAALANRSCRAAHDAAISSASSLTKFAERPIFDERLEVTEDNAQALRRVHDRTLILRAGYGEARGAVASCFEDHVDASAVGPTEGDAPVDLEGTRRLVVAVSDKVGLRETFRACAFPPRRSGWADERESASHVVA